MKKKIISLLLVAMVSATALISCGKTETSKTSEPSVSTSEEAPKKEPSSPADSGSENTNIVGESNKPTVEVTQIATISDFKDKDKTEIEKLLGTAISEESTKSVYEKDNYTFEVTYANSKCNEIKIIPKIDMKYPADGTNILKLVGINVNKADTISPAGLEWNNKFDTFKINVVSNNQTDGKIAYATIILTEASK